MWYCFFFWVWSETREKADNVNFFLYTDSDFGLYTFFCETSRSWIVNWSIMSIKNVSLLPLVKDNHVPVFILNGVQKRYVDEVLLWPYLLFWTPLTFIVCTISIAHLYLQYVHKTFLPIHSLPFFPPKETLLGWAGVRYSNTNSLCMCVFVCLWCQILVYLWLTDVTS